MSMYRQTERQTDRNIYQHLKIDRLIETYVSIYRDIEIYGLTRDVLSYECGPNCPINYGRRLIQKDSRQHSPLYSERFFSSSFSSVNNMWQNIKEAINQVITDHVPTKRTAARHTDPWVATQLRRAMRRKHRAYKTAKHTKSPPDWEDTKRLSTRTREISGLLTNSIWKM